MPFCSADMKAGVLFDGPRGLTYGTLSEVSKREGVVAIYNHGHPTKNEFQRKNAGCVFVPEAKGGVPQFCDALAASRRQDSLLEMVWIVHKDGNHKLIPCGVGLIAKKQLIAKVADTVIA